MNSIANYIVLDFRYCLLGHVPHVEQIHDVQSWIENPYLGDVFVFRFPGVLTHDPIHE